MSDTMPQVSADNTNIAVINTNIIYIQRDINDIKLSLKDTYATKDSMSEFAKVYGDRLVRLERESNFWRFLSPTLSAIFSAVMTFFVLNYFSFHK